jgi:peptidyl-prolyl cis-trans isomerase C
MSTALLLGFPPRLMSFARTLQHGLPIMTAAVRFRLLAGVAAAVVIAAAAFAYFYGMNAPEAQTAAAPAPGAAAPAVPGAPAPAVPATGEPGGGIVASIDGDPITEQDLDIAYDEFADQLSRFSIDQRRDVTVDLLIHIRLLAQAAAAQGIDKEPAMVERLRLARERALYNEYLNRLFDKAVTQEAAQKLYDEQTAKAGEQFEYHVRHILVPTEAEAKDVIAQLNMGADFAKLAADKSIDTGSAANGGDLGFLAKGDTVAPFEMAAFNLNIGEYTKTPVESQFGFHVIKLDEKRAAPPKSFQDSIPDLQDQLAQNAFQKTLDDLSAKSKIVKAPPIGQQPAPPAAAPAAPAPAK